MLPIKIKLALRDKILAWSFLMFLRETLASCITGWLAVAHVLQKSLAASQDVT